MEAKNYSGKNGMKRNLNILSSELYAFESERARQIFKQRRKKHTYFQLNGELEVGHISFFCPKVLNLESDFKNNPPQARFGPSSWHLDIKLLRQSGTTENSFGHSNHHAVKEGQI